MEQNVQSWSKTTKSIFTAILLLYVGTIVSGMLTGMNWIWSTKHLMTEGSVGTNLFTIITWLFELAVIVGYFLYMVGLGNLISLVGKRESSAIRQIRIAVILALVATVLQFFHVSIYITCILNLIAQIVMLVGFNTLKKSETLSLKATKGFSRLFTAMLITIIGSGILLFFFWVPIVPAALSGIITIVGYALIISGWNIVKNSTAPIA